MTGSDTLNPPIPLSEKLSLVTHHHLLTRVPVKLDLDNWNYGSWEYFFEQLCESYNVDKFLRAPVADISTSNSTPLTPEELKVDKIMLSWILFTLSDSLRARLVVTRPKSAKEAWSLISEIVKDNKRSRTIALKAELRFIKLRDQIIGSYFQKIDSIVTILTSLGAHVNDEDIVRSLLLNEEMRLKSKMLASPMDSSSPMVFVANSSNNSRSSSTPQGKSWKPCFNFAKGNCQFGESCRYVHDANARVPKSGFNKGIGTSENLTHDLLNKLLAQLGQATVLPHAFTAGTLQDPFTGAWNMDTGASSQLNNSITSLSTILNSYNDCTIEFDSFGFSVKDFKTRRVLLRCDSIGDLYPVTTPSPIPQAFLISQHTWHQRLGYPGGDVLRHLVSNKVILCNKEKLRVICHAC
ncbi:ribonuclease H-like domain-containing protein [Tanacetum coccineum]